MLTRSFLPRNSATDTGRPSTADGSAKVGNVSPGLRPFGRGALRAQRGFVWPAGLEPRAMVQSAASSGPTTRDLMMPPGMRLHLTPSRYFFNPAVQLRTTVMGRELAAPA